MAMMYLLLLLCFVSQVSASWNTNQELIGKVIHVESLLHRGEWWASRKNLFAYRWVGVQGSPERGVYFQDWTQFKVISCDNGNICFESMKYKNHYMDGEDNTVELKQSNYPNDKVWAQWTVECEDGQLSRCRFLSAVLGRYMAVKYQTFPVKDKWAILTGPLVRPHRASEYFRILSPVPRDFMASLLETENQSSLGQQKEITFFVGVTKSKTVSKTINAGLTAEIACAFGKVGGFVSGSWKTETSTTFETSRETKYLINMPPGTRINFKQLTGVYGPFKIASRKFVIECTLLKTGAPCMSYAVTYSMVR